MAGVAARYLAGLVDARTPLLVADDLGRAHPARAASGAGCRGTPSSRSWSSRARVRCSDGRLMVRPAQPRAGRSTGSTAARARQAALNQKLYGAALAVPLGLVTRVSAAGEQDIADRVASPVGGSRRRGDAHRAARTSRAPSRRPAPTSATGSRSGLGTIVSRVAKAPARRRRARARRARWLRRRRPPCRCARPGPSVRADVTPVPLRSTRPSSTTATAVRRLPEERQLRRPGLGGPRCSSPSRPRTSARSPASATRSRPW